MQLRKVFAMSSWYSLFYGGTFFLFFLLWHSIFYLHVFDFITSVLMISKIYLFCSTLCLVFMAPLKKKKKQTRFSITEKEKNCVVNGKRRLVENFRWVRSLTQCSRTKIKYRVLLSFLSPETRGRNLLHLWYYSPF